MGGVNLTKKCNSCGEVKTLSEFYKHDTSKDGLSGSCKHCVRERAKAWRVANPERAKASDRAKGRKSSYTEAAWADYLKGRHKVNQSEEQWAKKLSKARKENIDESLWDARREVVRGRILKENRTEADWAEKVEYDRLYREGHREVVRESCRNWREKNVKKSRAHARMWTAIHNGSLLQGVCEVCGSTTVHGASRGL